MAEVVIGKYIARSNELTEIEVTISVDGKRVMLHRLGHWDAPGRVFFEQDYDDEEAAQEAQRCWCAESRSRLRFSRFWSGSLDHPTPRPKRRPPAYRRRSLTRTRTQIFTKSRYRKMPQLTALAPALPEGRQALAVELAHLRRRRGAALLDGAAFAGTSRLVEIEQAILAL
jgi:hypothetical protein